MECQGDLGNVLGSIISRFAISTWILEYYQWGSVFVLSCVVAEDVVIISQVSYLDRFLITTKAPNKTMRLFYYTLTRDSSLINIIVL